MNTITSMNDDERLCTVEEVAEYLGDAFSPVTVRRWCRDGIIKAVKIGKRWVIPESEARRIKREGVALD